MLLPTRKVNARIRKEKKTNFSTNIWARALWGVVQCCIWFVRADELQPAPQSPRILRHRARPPSAVSLYTIYISLCSQRFFYAARDIRCVLGILAILKSSQAHTEKKNWENINIVMRAYRLALARSHLIRQVTTHFNIELSLSRRRWLWRV